MFRINVPHDHGIFKIAADELARYTELMTGCRPEVTSDTTGDLIVLGSSADNSLTASLTLSGQLPVLAYRSDSDDYYLRSLTESGRQLLFLGGGRPRSLLYAVYDFLERNGCSWFYDGDIVPERQTVLLSGFDVVESPRFTYRGLRYFAHRGLHRFQAEHWTLSDWRKELDWVLKKRLNLFMLRIGMDDVFQKAFPETVPYPKDNVPCSEQFSRSYNDRTHFWSLEQRGKLRKAVLDYAFERDLMHPEDTGTMSHWYSRTPQEFLDRFNPPFIPQSSAGYGEPSGLVWDIRHDRWLDRYFNLTETHIKHYGKGQIFHTIGLAERKVSANKRINHLWKLYAYRRIIGRLRKSYPEPPLLLASWDFYNTQWSPEEMRELINTLNPKNTLIFDYTSDSESPDRWFMNWNVYGNFPWIFGIFQAYEPVSDLCGNYEAIRQRLPLADQDPQCKGMVMWPENAHTDVLMYEFFAANAWRPQWHDIHDFLPSFCRKRYGNHGEKMLSLWQRFVPVLQAGHWTDNGYGGVLFAHLNGNWVSREYDPKRFKEMSDMNMTVIPCLKPCADVLKDLYKLPMDDARMRKDLIDMGRTAANRMFQYLWLQVRLRPHESHETKRRWTDLMKGILETMANVIGANEEFSLSYSLEKLSEGGKVNPIFENTLKGNSDNGYCRSFIYELFMALYLPEMEQWARHEETGEDVSKEMEAIRETFYARPLREFRPDVETCIRQLPQEFRRLADLAEVCCHLCNA